MRLVVLDTETTGLDPETGHRIVEIGAVEIKNHAVTGQAYHQYINPERDMPPEAEQIHGLSGEFLSSYPVFKTVAAEFLDFIRDSPLVIHNAAFDLRFLNAELSQVGQSPLDAERAIDTLLLARRKFPGASVSLDALCRRFLIDNSAREKHGALLDSELLAEVYLELIGGRQPGLTLSQAPSLPGTGRTTSDWKPGRRGKALPARITEVERQAHQSLIDSLDGAAIWNNRQP